MMYGFSYERLTRITETQKPYRGSTNRYPMDRRARNEKYFFVEMENGEKVYDIVYGNRYTSDIISKETYDTLKALNSDRVWESQEYDFEKHEYIDGATVYYQRRVSPNVLARVRPDNTVEFTKKEYYQGERNFLSQNVSGRFSIDSRRGGLIYSRNGAPKALHAIHEGMRIACDSDMAVVPYEIELKKVDRKKAKETLKPYDDFFKVNEVMCKAMPFEQLKDTAIDICNERFPEEKVLYRIDNQRFLKEARACIHSAPFDAFVLYALAYDVYNFLYSFKWGRSSPNDQGDKTYGMYMATKRRILKDLYVSHKDIFTTYRVQGGDYFPASEWGTNVIVNGEVVRQL